MAQNTAQQALRAARHSVLPLAKKQMLTPKKPNKNLMNENTLAIIEIMIFVHKL